MANYFDKYDSPENTSSGNYFDKYDEAAQNNNNTPKQNAFWDTIDVINKNFADVANTDLQIAAKNLSNLGIGAGFDKINNPVLPGSNSINIGSNADYSSFQNNIANQQAIHQRDYNAAMKNSPIAGTIADIGSKIGAAVATPGTQPFLAGTLGEGLLARIGQSAVGSGIAGSQQPVAPGESRFENALNSAAVGGLLQGGLEGIGTLASKGASTLFKTPVQEAADAVDQGLLSTVGSATGNKAAQEAEGFLGRIPFVGARGAINKEAETLKNATINTLNDLNATGTQVQANKALQNSFTKAYDTVTNNTNKAYDAAKTIATNNNLRINLSNAANTASSAIDDLGGLSQEGFKSLKPDAVNSKAAGLLNDLSNLNSNINPATGEQIAPSISAAKFDVFRRNLDSTIEDAYKSDNDALGKILSSVRDSLDDDLISASNQPGASKEFANAALNARETFKSQKAPFYNIPELSKAINGNIDSDQLLNMLVKNDRPELTKNIVSNLDKEGGQAFTSALMNKVYRDSIEAVGEGAEKFNLSTFSKNIHNLGETINALPKVERIKILGMQRLITRGDNLIKASNASAYGIPGTAGTGIGIAVLLHSIPGFIGLTGGTKLISAALTSPTITRNLIKLAGGKLATKAEDGLIKRTLNKLVGKTVQNSINEMFSSGTKPAIAVGLGTNNNNNNN